MSAEGQVQHAFVAMRRLLDAANEVIAILEDPLTPEDGDPPPVLDGDAGGSSVNVDLERARCEFRYVLDGLWNGTLGDDAQAAAINHLRSGLAALGATWTPEASPDFGGPSHPTPCV